MVLPVYTIVDRKPRCYFPVILSVNSIGASIGVRIGTGDRGECVAIGNSQQESTIGVIDRSVDGEFVKL